MGTEKMSTDQIAVIAWNNALKTYKEQGTVEAIAEIQAAIEKATKRVATTCPQCGWTSSRAVHASEIDPVSGYRYDQEIPEPICEMKQIEPAHASEQVKLEYDPTLSRNHCPICGDRYCDRHPEARLKPAHASGEKK